MRHVDFVRRTNYLSDWIQAVIRHNSRSATTLHLRPESNCIQFWAQWISLRMRSAAIQMADDVLKDTQPKANSVKTLRSF